MRQIGLYLLAFVVAIFLLAYTMTYTIRFTEAGVKTRFGSAGADSEKLEPGLKFKLPLMESVTTYDTRPRITQARLETASTKDGRQLVMETFCVWRISKPLAFFQRFSGTSAGGSVQEHYRQADETVKSNLRNALGAVSKFEISQLFNADQKQDGLGELERQVLASLARKSDPAGANTPGAEKDFTLSALGIEVVDVGISQIVLPQETTSKVFERMIASQDKIAKEITASAEATATGIRSRADRDVSRIESFAKQLSAEIRAKGDKEAEQFYAMQKDNPALAQFLIEVQMLKEVNGRKGTQLILPWTTPGLRIINPGFVDQALAEMQKNGAAPKAGGAK